MKNTVMVAIVVMVALFSFACSSEKPLLLPISEFKDLGEGVLVLCANDAEKDSAVAFLREHNSRRHHSTTYEVKDRSGYSEAFIPVRKLEDKGLPVGRYPNGLSKVRVVVVSQNSRALSSLPKGFGIIQLRGHTSDMAPLIAKFKEFRADNTFLVMGGCESVQFVKDLQNPQTPILAGKMTLQATTSQNSHTLVAIIDRFALWESWGEMNTSLTSLSGNLRNDTLIPGSTEYQKLLEEEAEKEE